MIERDKRRERVDQVKSDQEVQDWLKAKVPSVNYIGFVIDEMHQAMRHHEIKAGEVPQIEKGTCAHCSHYKGDGQESLGYCRRYAPQPTSPLMMVIAEYLADIGWMAADNEDSNWRMHETKSLTMWPMVSESDSCGEYAHNARLDGTQSEHLTTDGAETPANGAE